MKNMLNTLLMKSNDGASSTNWKRSRVHLKLVRILWVLLISGLVGTRLLLDLTIFSLHLYPSILELPHHLMSLSPQLFEEDVLLLSSFLPESPSDQQPVPVKVYQNADINKQ